MQGVQNIQLYLSAQYQATENSLLPFDRFGEREHFRDLRGYDFDT